MITGVHEIILTKDADGVRAFLRDVLEFPSVDAGEGWLKGRRVSRPISDEGFGLLTAIKLPGGGELGLYEPRHPTPNPVTAG